LKNPFYFSEAKFHFKYLGLLWFNGTIHWFIFKNNQITLFTCFTCIPITGIRLPKIGIIFYCVFLSIKVPIEVQVPLSVWMVPPWCAHCTRAASTSCRYWCCSTIVTSQRCRRKRAKMFGGGAADGAPGDGARRALARPPHCQPSDPLHPVCNQGKYAKVSKNCEPFDGMGYLTIFFLR